MEGAKRYQGGILHSLMSGKYAQKRLIGSRTVCLNRRVRDEQFSVDSLMRVRSSLPIRSVKRFDGLSVEIFHRLLIATAHAVIGPGISVESVDCFRDPHLRCRHRCTQLSARARPRIGAQRRNLTSKRIQEAFCFFLKLVGRRFHCTVASENWKESVSPELTGQPWSFHLLPR